MGGEGRGSEAEGRGSLFGPLNRLRLRHTGLPVRATGRGDRLLDWGVNHIHTLTTDSTTSH